MRTYSRLEASVEEHARCRTDLPSVSRAFISRAIPEFSAPARFHDFPPLVLTEVEGCPGPPLSRR